jgi:hypothetical protein
LTFPIIVITTSAALLRLLGKNSQQQQAYPPPLFLIAPRIYASMVAMGGGPDIPARDGASKEKQLVLCTLPWPEEQAAHGIQALKETFGDIEVEYHYSRFENGKLGSVDVPEGM